MSTEAPERVIDDQLLDAVLACNDPCCEHDHPPAIARLIVTITSCHTGHLFLCEPCAQSWAAAMLRFFAPIPCLVCAKIHTCAPWLHMVIVPL